ncbi:hypothetical protein [Geodermatophilus sp. SYSU D01176]
MTPDTTPPPPGSMTVPPLSGWEDLLTVLLLLIALTVASLVVAASTAHVRGRSEWQAELDARSSRRRDAATGPPDAHHRSVEPVGPGPG